MSQIEHRHLKSNCRHHHHHINLKKQMSPSSSSSSSSSSSPSSDICIYICIWNMIVPTHSLSLCLFLSYLIPPQPTYLPTSLQPTPTYLPTYLPTYIRLLQPPPSSISLPLFFLPYPWGWWCNKWVIILLTLPYIPPMPYPCTYISIYINLATMYACIHTFFT